MKNAYSEQGSFEIEQQLSAHSARLAYRHVAGCISSLQLIRTYRNVSRQETITDAVRILPMRTTANTRRWAIRITTGCMSPLCSDRCAGGAIASHIPIQRRSTMSENSFSARRSTISTFGRTTPDPMTTSANALFLTATYIRPPERRTAFGVTSLMISNSAPCCNTIPPCLSISPPEPTRSRELRLVRPATGHISP